MSAQPTHTFSLSNVDCENSRALDPEWFRKLCFLFLVALALRVIFVFVAPNNSTDAWSRYLAAMVWLRHPSQLPPATASAAWLPMHFWILGSVVWVTKSEIGARCCSVLLGSFTVLLLAGIARRPFGPRVAFWSALLLAFFGFHVAFSVTTGSEALTIFLMAFGLYAWIRYAECGSVFWMLISAAAFSVACLCRFEPWLCGPTLALLLVNVDSGSRSSTSGRRWLQAFTFGLLSSLGAIGWLAFSYLRWGDALKLPHRTMWLNAHFQPSHHSVSFRGLAVPGSIVTSLSPVIAALGILGAIHIARSGTRTARAVAALTFVLFAFNYYSCVKYEATQARYTLLYSWLIIPLAIEGLVCSGTRFRLPQAGITFAAVLTFFILWQAGVATAAIYAPQPVADHLGALSPMIPLHAELRELTKWVRANGSKHESVILDDYNWESVDIFRFAQLPAQETFAVSQRDYDDPSGLHHRLQQFVKVQHPRLLICSPQGLIGTEWCAGSHNKTQVPGLELQLLPLWHGQHWRIYRISYQ